VHTRHASVWNDDQLLPDALRQMLDASITKLTGLNDAREAWVALFAPTERIAIKVNTIRGSAVWTHVPLVMAVAQCLQDAGSPAGQIVIYDRRSDELINAGYPHNNSSSEVHCYGTNEQYTTGWRVLGKRVDLSKILLDSDALINVPILKPHGSSGITFAIKNHYGSFAYPWRPTGWWHEEEGITRGLPGLNALPPIKDLTRLVIGDVLEYASLDWSTAVPGDSIFMSFDPVAHDMIGLDWAVKVATEAAEIDPAAIEAGAGLAKQWLANAAGLGLGTDDPNNIDLIELHLG
jgi:hypothetical protein